MLKRALQYFGLVGVMIILSSCSSKPTHFYLLNDVQTQYAKKSQQLHREVIGIGPVTFAKYLNQSPIVTRTSLNKLNVDEFHQWGEPLRDNFTRVLAKDVQNILQTHYVATYPWPLSESIHYQVVVEVFRFDATSEGKVICEMNYQIIKSTTRERVLSKTKTYRSEERRV